MKPPVIIAIAILFAIYSNGQPLQTVTFPKHTVSPTDARGKIIWSRLTNKSSKPITLTPILPQGYAADSASLVRQLLAQVTTTNRDSACLQLMFIVGHYIKSPSKTNTLSMFFESPTDDSLNARKYALIGSELSIPNWQCQNFVREAIAVFEATGFFNDNDFIIDALQFHTVLEVKYRNDTIMLDMTSNTPVFIVANPAKACGYASASDLVNDTSLLTESQRYLYNGHPIFENASISDYKIHFQSLGRSLYTKIALDNFDGRIVLCPGCSMEYRDTLNYLIDTSVQSNRYLVEESAHQCSYYNNLYKLTGDIDDLDSTMLYFSSATAYLLNLSMQDAIAAIDNDDIQYYGNTGNWYPSYDTKLPLLSVNKPATAGSTYWGRDISFPFTVSSYTYNNRQTNFQLYAANFFGTAPVVQDNQFNYANGYNTRPIAANSTLSLSLLYNPALINFYHGGAMFTTGSNPDSLLIEASIDTCIFLKPAHAVSGIGTDTLILSGSPFLSYYSPYVTGGTSVVSPPTKGSNKIIYNAGSGCRYVNNRAKKMPENEWRTNNKADNNRILWTIYPSPARNAFYVKSSEETEAALHLFDMNGNQVLVHQLNGATSAVDASGLVNGSYIYLIETGKTVLCKGKIVVVR